MKQFRFGILGAGGIAHKFCNAVGKVDDACVAAVASKDQKRAWRFAKRHGIEDFYSDYEHLLAREDIDAIYIATTHNFHYENIIACLKHNKPVLCEKSMVPTAAQAQEIFSLAKEKKLFVMEAMWSRFLPHINQARQPAPLASLPAETLRTGSTTRSSAAAQPMISAFTRLN